MIKKNKGFTLIELLAVIVILGLLMAIAIPSVTKYINESRKKTIVSTIGNYIGSAMSEVNDLEYIFTDSSKIYALPIECISLERGGTNPLGEWHQANDDYFAYVLVQYDEENSSYRYGFTFKDSNGYGLYPIVEDKLNSRGSQISTGLEISRPKTGDITTLTDLANWEESGFEIDSTTKLQVLVASSEGENGDGINTCTLCQKGKNYENVEEEKKNDAGVITPPVEEKPPVATGTFQIQGQSGSFTYEVGMTWLDWLYSDYNTVFDGIEGQSITDGTFYAKYDSIDEAYIAIIINLDSNTCNSFGHGNTTLLITGGTYQLSWGSKNSGTHGGCSS